MGCDESNHALRRYLRVQKIKAFRAKRALASAIPAVPTAKAISASREVACSPPPSDQNSIRQCTSPGLWDTSSSESDLQLKTLDKKEARRIRNRQSAIRSRLKTSVGMDYLRRRVHALEAENIKLKSYIEQLHLSVQGHELSQRSPQHTSQLSPWRVLPVQPGQDEGHIRNIDISSGRAKFCY